MSKGDLSSAITVTWSGLGLWIHSINAAAAEFMPVITAFGILSGTALTAWYYRQQINQRKRDRALLHRRIEHEIAMGRSIPKIDVRKADHL